MKLISFVDLPWSALCAIWLLTMILVGGVSTPSHSMIVVHSVASATLAMIALWRLRNGFSGYLAIAGTLLGVGAFGLVASHLIPLPPSVWQALPGRDLVVSTARLADPSNQNWMPLSLAPDMTRLALLAMLPAFASFLAFLSVDRRDLPLIGFALAFAAIFCVFLGFLQRHAPADSFLHFYGFKVAGRSSGSFGNANYFGTQLFATIPFMAAIAMTLQERSGLRGWLVFIFVMIYAGIILVGLAITGSRAGILFAMLSVLLSVLAVYRPGVANEQRKRGILPFVLVGCFFIFGQIGMAAILGLAEIDPLSDYRTTMLGVSMQTTRAFFPAGSGFGSFIPVYQMFERPDTIISAYVNHVHNDWLEIVLEGGAPAILLLAVFLVIFLSALVSVFQLAMDNSINGYFRAAAVALLLMLLHAVIDFPLRTPAISSFAAACFAMMLVARSRHGDGDRSRSRKQETGNENPAPVRAFSRPARGFRPLDEARKPQK